MEFKLETIKGGISEFFNKIWQNLVWVLVLLLVLDFLVSAILFFGFYFKTKEEPESPAPLLINQGLLNDFVSEYLKRELFFKQADQAPMPDIFRGFSSKID